MSEDAKIERDLLKINGNMAPPSGRILKTFLWWEASLCSRPYKLTSRLFFFNLNLASFLNCKALFLPVLMDIRQLVTPVFVFALSQLSRKLKELCHKRSPTFSSSAGDSISRVYRFLSQPSVNSSHSQTFVSISQPSYSYSALYPM